LEDIPIIVWFLKIFVKAFDGSFPKKKVRERKKRRKNWANLQETKKSANR
jgi:hypothetical protein